MTKKSRQKSFPLNGCANVCVTATAQPHKVIPARYAFLTAFHIVRSLIFVPYSNTPTR